MTKTDTTDERYDRPPEIYDVVEAPAGYECQLWKETDDGDMVACKSPADVLFVFEGGFRPETDDRKNALACADCAPKKTQEDELIADGGTSTDDWTMSCWDCDREAGRRALQMREVMDTSGPGIGYEYITVPLCSSCIGTRFGYDCPQCGLHHDTKDDARYCCQRRPGEAPDCPECGRRMKRGAWGYSPTEGQTVEWAECECCPVAWGRFTGWEMLDDDPCKHVETDPREEGSA